MILAIIIGVAVLAFLLLMAIFYVGSKAERGALEDFRDERVGL